jgi:hypothetical protein
MFRVYILDVKEFVVLDVRCVLSECPRKQNLPLGKKKSVRPAKRGNCRSIGNEEEMIKISDGGETS